MMTTYSPEQIEELAKTLIGLEIKAFSHVTDDDYFVLTTDEGEITFRFQADLVITDTEQLRLNTTNKNRIAELEGLLREAKQNED